MSRSIILVGLAHNDRAEFEEYLRFLHPEYTIYCIETEEAFRNIEWFLVEAAPYAIVMAHKFPYAPIRFHKTIPPSGCKDETRAGIRCSELVKKLPSPVPVVFYDRWKDPFSIVADIENIERSKPVP